MNEIEARELLNRMTFDEKLKLFDFLIAINAMRIGKENGIKTKRAENSN